jgi:hypothetical protein
LLNGDFEPGGTQLLSWHQANISAPARVNFTRSRLVLPELAAFDREGETGLVLGRAAAVLLRKRPVDQFDIDAAPASKSDAM